MGRAQRTGRTASRVAGLAFLASSLLFLLFVGIGPRTGAYRTLTVLTGSMRPTIPPGSMVVVTPVDPHALRVGDVITYRAPVGDRRVVTHRIVEIREPGSQPVVRTKGDANDAPDSWLARLDGSPAWRVRTVVPLAGRAINVLRSDGARTLTTVVVPAALALSWLAEIWRTGAGSSGHAPVGFPTVAPGPAARQPVGGRRRDAVVAPLAFLTVAGGVLWLAGARSPARHTSIVRWAGIGGRAR